MQQKDKLIVLRKVKYGESDLIIHGITSSGVSISLMAKGAAKSKRRFGGGVLEPTHYIKVTYNEPKTEGRMGILTEAEVINDFRGIRLDYDKLELALYFLKTVAQVCQEGDLEEVSLFNLLGNSLKSLEDSTRPEHLRILFELKLLDQQGVLPPELRSPELLPVRIHEHESLDQLKPVVQRVKAPLHSTFKHFISSRVL